MTTSRFQARYVGDHTPARPCSTSGCPNPTRSKLSGLCDRCRGRLRRLGHAEQSVPDGHRMVELCRRMETQRGSLRMPQHFKALEAQWSQVIATLAGIATPTYGNQKRLTHNKWETEAAAMLRDVFEQMTLTRALDLLGALMLLRLERPDFFRSDEAFRCTVIEMFRRETLYGRHIVSVDEETGGIRSYRRDVSRQTRNSAFGFLYSAIGAAAQALATREHKRATEEASLKQSYYTAVEALAEAPMPSAIAAE
jgi:hypothetical protein